MHFSRNSTGFRWGTGFPKRFSCRDIVTDRIRNGASTQLTTVGTRKTTAFTFNRTTRQTKKYIPCSALSLWQLINSSSVAACRMQKSEALFAVLPSAPHESQNNAMYHHTWPPLVRHLTLCTAPRVFACLHDKSTGKSCSATICACCVCASIRALPDPAWRILWMHRKTSKSAILYFSIRNRLRPPYPRFEMRYVFKISANFWDAPLALIC